MTLMLFNVHIIQGTDLSIPTNWDHMTFQIFIICLLDDWWIKNVWREYFVQILSFCWDLIIIIEESLFMEMSVLAAMWMFCPLDLYIGNFGLYQYIYLQNVYIHVSSQPCPSYILQVGGCMFDDTLYFILCKPICTFTNWRNTNTSWILWKSQKDSPHCRNLENQY